MKNLTLVLTLLFAPLGASAAKAAAPANVPGVLASVIAALNEIVPLECNDPAVNGSQYTYTCVKASDGKTIQIQATAPYRNPAVNALVMIQAPIDLGEKISDAAFQKFTKAVAEQSLAIYQSADASVSWDGVLIQGNSAFPAGEGFIAGFQHSDQTSALFVETNLENGSLLRLFVGLEG